MSEEIKEEVKDVKKRSPRMTKKQALTLIRKANQPIEPGATDKEIIEFAKSLPKEKYFRIKLQEKPNVNAPAYIGVAGIPFTIIRGEEVVVPERVVKALENAVSFVPYQKKDPVTGELEMHHKHISAELYSVLGEVEAP